MSTEIGVMQATLIVLQVLHVLSGVFWAGTTFALARMSGNQARALFRPQMGAATIAILSGASLWFLLHRGSAGLQEHVLGLGALFAVAAAGIQGATQRRGRVAAGVGELENADDRAARGQRLAAGCLTITTACMAASRFI